MKNCGGDKFGVVVTKRVLRVAQDDKFVVVVTKFEVDDG
jgi:hypothetical protein